jgi:Kazal-type serine protease inhibitor domain
MASFFTAGLTCSRLRCADNERCLMNELTGTPTCVHCDRPCITVGQPAAHASTDTSGALAAFGAMVNSGPGGFEVSRRTICGTDGLTYGSYCEMTRAACDRGVVIDARHAGSCNGGTGELSVYDFRFLSRRVDRKIILHRALTKSLGLSLGDPSI